MKATSLSAVCLLVLMSGCLDDYNPYMCGGGSSQTIDPPEIHRYASCQSYHQGWEWGHSTLEGCVGPATLEPSGRVEAGWLTVDIQSDGTLLAAVSFEAGDIDRTAMPLGDHRDYRFEFDGNSAFRGSVSLHAWCVGPSTPQPASPT